MVASAVETEENVIKPFHEWKYNGRPAGNGWNRSTNNAQWGIDYYNRTGTSKSNMFDNRPNETQYFYTDFDGAGAELTGANSYEVTFAPGQEPPDPQGTSAQAGQFGEEEGSGNATTTFRRLGRSRSDRRVAAR